MSSTDDPITTPEVSTGTGRQLLAELITVMAVDRREREQERAEQALFREWLTKSITAMQVDFKLLIEDGRVRNERLSAVEKRLDELACSPVHDNGGRENCGA